ELGIAEWRRHLVLHDAGPHAVADVFIAVLDRAGPPDVDAHRAVALQGPAAGGGLGAAEHHADLLADLVDEDHRAIRAGDHAGELPHRLAHEPGLESHDRVAHLAFDLSARDEGGDRVDHDHIHRVGADEQFADLQGLLAA